MKLSSSPTTLLPSLRAPNNGYVRNKDLTPTNIDMGQKVDDWLEAQSKDDVEKGPQKLKTLENLTRIDRAELADTCVQRNERRHEERQERPRIEVKDDMASQCGRKACKRTRPPLRDFVDVQKGTHIKNGDTCTTNRSHPLSLISHPRPSLATLVEESESAIDAKDERERSTTAIAEQDITECNRKPNEGALCNESLLSSLASINNNLCTLTLPQMALRSSSTPDLLHSNDPPHDPDPRDFSAPPATQPLTNQTTPRSAPSDRGGWEFTREPAPYPRVWALRNELDFGRKSARGVRSWRGKKSPLGTEL